MTSIPRWSVLLPLVSCLLAARMLLAGAAAPKPNGIARAARAQIGRTLRYDAAYRALDYPNGDVPIEVGVCTDVVVRALRSSRGIDLQRLVHEDMKLAFSAYPRKWGARGPDRNIDHRRVPNLETYFRRKGYQLPVTRNAADYRAGDLVTCIVPPNLPHIMIVSDRTTVFGRLLVIHNIGQGTREEDRLFEFRLTGHYRLAPWTTLASPGLNGRVSRERARGRPAATRASASTARRSGCRSSG